MKNKIFSILAIITATMSTKAQNKPFEKGSFLLFWGYNNAIYSNSDIHFKGDGYDFQLNNVQAKDRQTPFRAKTYFNPKTITIPQVNYGITYFIKDNLGIQLSIDHMKYVMNQNQSVAFHGNISDKNYAALVQNGQIDLSSGDFLTYEHTDGLNYLNVGVQKYKHLLDSKNLDIFWGYGAGAGALVPKTNAKLMGNERSDRFHFAGFGLDARTSMNFILWKHLVGKVEAKYGYINLPDVKTTKYSRDTASQDFAFGEVIFGIGYTFGTKRN